MTRRTSVDGLVEVLAAYRFPIVAWSAPEESVVELDDVLILRQILEAFVFPQVGALSPNETDFNLSDYKFPARRGTIGSDVSKRVFLPKLKRILSCTSVCSPRQESPNTAIASQLTLENSMGATVYAKQGYTKQEETTRSLEHVQAETLSFKYISPEKELL